MNRIYRSLWNPSLGAWVAAPETARAGGNAATGQVAESGFGGSLVKPVRTRMFSQGGLSIAIAVALYALSPSAALAQCATSGTALTCTSPSTDPWQAGDINGTDYINIDKLDIESGAWTLTSPLFTAATNNPAVRLNGGVLKVDSSGLATAVITANGGGLSASTASTTLDNNILFDFVGLTVDTASGDLTLNGTLSPAGSLAQHGAGMLTKTGQGTLTLNGANSYLGGTNLAGGTLLAGSNTALGSGALNVTGNAALDAANNSGITLANAIVLNQNTLNLSGGNRLALSGNITGSGSLIKNGLGELTLSGNNTFSGGLRLNAGTLALASANSLGSGNLTAAGGILNNTTALTLNNAVQLLGSLTLNSAQNLVLNGVISGTGNLAKTGTGNLALTGNNTYTGNTFLLGGNTIVGSNTAFGTGNVTTGIAALDSSTAVTLANNFTVLGQLTIGGNADLTLSGAINGAGGSLIKNGSGTLTLLGNNTYIAGTVLNAGTLAVGRNDSLGSGNLTVSGSSTLMASNNGVALTNDIQTNSSLTIGGANNLTLISAISGDGSLGKTGSSTLTLNGTNAYHGGTALNGGVVVVGNNSAFGTGAVVANAGNTATTVRNPQTRFLINAFVVNGNMTLDTPAELQLLGALNGSGTLTKTGSDEVLLLSTGNFDGNLDVRAGYVTTVVGNALGNLRSASLTAGSGLNVAGNINIGSLTGSGIMNITNGQVRVGDNNLDSVFAGTVAQTGGLNKVGSGVLELTGASTNTGLSTVSAGTLKVTGDLLGNGGLNVDAGATLTGSGSVNGTTTLADGATLVGYSGQTLNFNNLVLSPDSIVNFNLGAPVTGGTELFNVNNALTIDGTFNIADFGGLGNGVYRLFNYGGSLTNNGAALGTRPTGVDPSELTLVTSTQNQINLLVASPNLVVQFWDGVDTTSNGLIEGGSGVWDATTANWVDHDGFGNLDWQKQFAVFLGATGTVTVDGQQIVNGMQFMTDGYQLVAGSNGSLDINNRNGAFFAVRVDPNVTATLDLPLTGSGTLTKLDVGTLVLNGANDYAGGTALNGGTLVLGNDSALGNGTLTTAANTTLDNNTAVTLGNAVNLSGQLNLGGSNNLTLNGAISGSGKLSKSGNGFLTLGSANTYLGGTSLNAGRLILGTDGSLGASTLTTANGTSLDTLGAVTLTNTLDLQGNLLNAGNNDLTLNGQVNGVGSLTKQGTATLALNGINTFSGGLNLLNGKLRLGHANALGSGNLSVGGASTLEINGPTSLGNNVQLNANLTLQTPNDLIFNGVLSGQAHMIKQGNGKLTLTNNNTMGGYITLEGGSLVVNNQLASQSVVVGSGTSLSGTGTLTGQAVIGINGNLDLQQGSTLTVGSLFLGNFGIINTALGMPMALSSPLLRVTGDLNLGVAKLNVTDQGGFGAGVYRLIDYSGNLAHNFLTINTLPIGVQAADVQIQTAIDKQVNLVVGGLSNISFWNGDHQTANGQIEGGEGIWNTLGTNWTNSNAMFNQAWNDKFAVFGGNGGTVVVNGAQAISGLQFLSDGYTLKGGAGGQLSISGFSNIRVGQNINTVLDIAIQGNGSLIKHEGGSLVLSGANTYTGTTRIESGTLQVGNGGVTGNLGTGAVSNSGQLIFNRSDDMTVANDISGTGQLVQAGSGATTLTGTSSYTGATTVAAGTLRAGSATALQQDARYQVLAGATLDLNGHSLQTSQLQSDGTVLLGAADLTLISSANQINQLNGSVQGTGQLIKQGQGMLALSGANHFSGGVKLKQGIIALGHEQGLGTGVLAMDDGTAIALTRDGMTIANAMHMTGNNDPIIDTGANNATWAGSITGAGFLTKQGSGTLTLSSTANTYTGATDIAQGTLQAGANNTFSSTSAHTVAAGAMLNLAGYNQRLASLNNNGVVLLSQPGTSTPGTVLTLTGPYVGNNATLGLSTVLEGNGSATDQLLLSGATAIASGNTTIQITNAGGLGAQTSGNGIELVATENGASLQANSFTLAGGKIDAGAFEYRLSQTAQGASLHSTSSAPPTPTPAYRTEVPLLSAMPAQLRQADMAMLGDMRRRTGDDTPQANVTSQDAAQHHGADAQRRVWSRALRISPKISQQGTVNPDSSGHLTGFQVGLDILTKQSTQAGLYVGQLSGNMDTSGFASGISDKHVGRNKLRNRYLGFYGSWQADSGLYVEGVIQAAEYRSSLQTVSVNGISTGATTKGHGWLASLEVGKPFALNANWQIEPQAQIVYSKLDLDDTRINNAIVQNKTDDDWTLRIGARIKGSFETRAGLLQPYGRVNLYKTSNSTDVARFITPASTTDVTAQGGYTTTELAAGASLQVNKRISLFGEVGRLWANGGDSRVKSGIQGAVGVKVLW